MFSTIPTGLRHNRRMAVLAGAFALAAPLGAAAQAQLWADNARVPAGARPATELLTAYRPLTVDLAAMQTALAAAPAEAQARTSTLVVSLPRPDGTAERFRVSQVPVMAPGLAAQFPQIRTYQAQGVDNPWATARLDVTPRGFHAQVLAPDQGTYYIDPAAKGDTEHYLAFFKKDMNQSARGWHCELNTPAPAGLPAPANLPRIPNGTQLKNYRLALACTPEYATAVCPPGQVTVTNTLAAMVTSVNRVGGVYETEVAVRLTLVANNNLLVFVPNGTNVPSPVYTNSSGSAMLNQNQQNVDRVIGAANYDIGHVFSTGGGGIAQRPSVCVGGSKARGVTGSPNPVGDAFDIDYVAHEMGHQFNGNHTFNSQTGSCGGGNRAGVAAYEPGSGTTIMAYAGICGSDDLQPHSDPYFHTKSYDEILQIITGGGVASACPTITATGNTPPVPNAGANYRIPKGTPFVLTGSATDADNDPLTYSWEQFNLGPAGAVNAPSGDAPIFRFFPPTTTPTRYFPLLNDLVNNTSTYGNQLPAYARRLIFRMVARDNRLGGGGVDYDSMNVVVAGNSGPFVVTEPNTNATRWQAGAPAQVRWDVAGTTAAPVSAANVDILLSTDGGFTYPITLAAGVPNDGFENLTLPASLPGSTTARVMVRGSGNVFFDISNQNFTVVATTGPTFFLSTANATTNTPLAVCPGQSGNTTLTVGQLQGFTGAVALTATNLPAGVTVAFANPTTQAGSSTQLTLNVAAGTAAGNYSLTLSGTSGGTTQTQVLNFTVNPSATAAATGTAPTTAQRATLRPRFTWSAVPNATGYEVQVSTDPNFAAGAATQTFAVAGPATSFVPPVQLAANTTYYWRVRATSACTTAPYSAGLSFQTGQQTCTTTASTQVPRSISPSGTPTVTSTVTITATERVGEVRLRNLDIAHTAVGELEVSLTNPAGQTVVVVARGTCPTGTDLQGSFDDLAAAAQACPLNNIGATVRPANALSALTGASAAGTWTLTVTDNANGNGGNLLGWGIELCLLGEAPAPLASINPLLGNLSGGTRGVDVFWTESSNPTRATSYELQRSFGNNTSYATIATIPVTSATAPPTYYGDQVTASGTYYYRIRGCNANGCSAWTTEGSVLGTSKNAQLAGISVAPNPSTGLVTLLVDNAQRGPLGLRLIDALGRTVQAQTLTKGAGALQHTLDLGPLSPGVYQLHVALPDGTSVVRLLKQ